MATRMAAITENSDTNTKIITNFLNLKESLQSLCKKYSHNLSQLNFIAVSKGQDFSKISHLFQETGHNYFAESYLNEFQEKYNLAQEKNLNLRWSFIGSLQSNKIHKIVKIADEIQSLYTLKHARYINRYAGEYNKRPFPVFIQINFANEANKSGTTFDKAKELANFITKDMKNLELKGLMFIPPKEFSSFHKDKSLKLYKTMKDQSKEIGIGELSLGMSNDLELAIASHTNYVRIGTALFGKREQKTN